MIDLCLSNLGHLITLINKENIKQLNKWGIQDRDPFEWLGFATEELGEMAKAISEHRWRSGVPEDVVKEAIQTATLCLKIAEMFENLLVTKVEEKSL